MSNVRFFVYGTLKSGLRNNYLITENGGRSLGPARLQSCEYVLLNGRGFPFVQPVTPEQFDRLQDAGMDSFIWGELFEAPESVMPILDRLEGYPRMYNRAEVEVFTNTGNGNKGKAWMYFMDKPVQEGDDICMNGEWWPHVSVVRLADCEELVFDDEN